MVLQLHLVKKNKKKTTHLVSVVSFFVVFVFSFLKLRWFLFSEKRERVEEDRGERRVKKAVLRFSMCLFSLTTLNTTPACGRLCGRFVCCILIVFVVVFCGCGCGAGRTFTHALQPCAVVCCRFVCVVVFGCVVFACAIGL